MSMLMQALFQYSEEQFEQWRAQAAAEKKDFYKFVVTKLRDIDYDEVPDDDRNEVKMALFSFMFGGSKKGFPNVARVAGEQIADALADTKGKK